MKKKNDQMKYAPHAVLVIIFIKDLNNALKYMYNDMVLYKIKEQSIPLMPLY